MSYRYGAIEGNPLHPMVPLMSSLTNGTNFMPQLAVASTMPPISGQSSLLQTHLPAGLNDNPLEFKNTNTQQNDLDKNNKNNANNNQMGAGPMDLENDNESSNGIDTTTTTPTTTSIAEVAAAATTNRTTLCCDPNINSNLQDEESSMHSNNSNACAAAAAAAASNKPILMSSDMFLNGMMGVGPPQQHSHPQSFMMMSGMIMDPASMALQMQQFPLMAAAAAAAAAAAIPPNGAQQGNTSTDNTQTQQSIVPVQIKEIITCKSCTLYPPNPNAPPPTIRERPPGCRTVFVGGLPENITEDIIREIFESCGEITTLRLSKKNFCHIRFVFEASVDSAIYLSGYRIRIANSTEPTNCGRLHVDYAQARDDQYEWECKQRQLQREQRHRERLERDRLRSMSPPPIVHYTEHEASNIAEKLKNDETFLKAVQTLIAWLERGDCSKKNANTFYSMIQSTNAHVRRLQNDRVQFEEELKRAREQYRKQMLNMTQQFTQIEKVFSAASHKKVWDHFTKAQRKNIDIWKKQSMDTRCVQVEDDEMEMSDDDRDYKGSSKRTKYDNDNLKEENDSLRCQLEACRNEINLVKSDLKSDHDIREQEIKVLQETIRNLQKQLIENKVKEKECSTKISELENKLKQANVKELLLKTKIIEVKSGISSKNSEIDENEKSHSGHSESLEDESVKSQSTTTTTTGTTGTTNNDTANQVSSSHLIQIKSEHIDLDEARIIGLVSTFLVVHPFGASPDYICSYLQRTQPNLRPRELEEILCRYRTLFCEEVTGIGAQIERKWKFCGFDGNESVSD